MASIAPRTTLRKVLEERFSRLIPDLETWLEAEFATCAEDARRDLAGHLNQAVRRLREAPGFAETAAILLDASGPFASGAAVFRVSGETVRGECARGLDGSRAARFGALNFPVSAAAAFAGAIAGRDPAVATGSAGELSPAVAELFAHPPQERVCLFPIVDGGGAAGLLYAWGEPRMAPLELLAQAAGAALAAGALPAKAEVLAAAADQQLRWRAQRFARVQVAEMRLYRPEDVAAGRARRDLYTALKDSIDAARDSFRRRFLPDGAAMPDYVHEELLHTLANDDPALLGETYPGPLA